MKNKKRNVALLLACVLAFGCGIGATIAWLTDKTEPVANTFTTSEVGLKLTETTKEFKMIPGWTIDKDPVVTVEAGSEDCWVFLKVEETSNLDEYICYEIDTNNWTRLDLEDESENYIDVYYCYAKDITEDRNIKVLAGGRYLFENDTGDELDGMTFTWESNQVLTKPDVTEEMMNDLKLENAIKPKLTFTAYASQYYKSNGVAFEPEEAWDLVKDLPNTDNSTQP